MPSWPIVVKYVRSTRRSTWTHSTRGVRSEVSMATDPLTGGRYAEPSVLILTSLAGGPKHGYALIQDIRDFAGVELGPGTLVRRLGPARDAADDPSRWRQTSVAAPTRSPPTGSAALAGAPHRAGPDRPDRSPRLATVMSRRSAHSAPAPAGLAHPAAARLLPAVVAGPLRRRDARHRAGAARRRPLDRGRKPRDLLRGLVRAWVSPAAIPWRRGHACTLNVS